MCWSDWSWSQAPTEGEVAPDDDARGSSVPETRADSARKAFRPALRACGRPTFHKRLKSRQKRFLKAGGLFRCLRSRVGGAGIESRLGLSSAPRLSDLVGSIDAELLSAASLDEDRLL
jgi:hypothetical protein